jgi:hypothetical protein
VPVSEPQSLPRNLIDEGCGDLGSPIDPDIPVADIVSIDNDDIRVVRSRKEGGKKQRCS